MSKAIISFLVLLIAKTAFSVIKLDPPFTNGMVLPARTKVTLGITTAVDPVVVKPSWGPAIRARGRKGRVEVTLPTPPAGTNYSLVVSAGSENMVLSDIASGKVFLLTGQSNAEMPMYLPTSGYPLIPAGQAEWNGAIYPNIRFARVQQANAATPQNDPPNTVTWEQGNGSQRGRFSAMFWRAVKNLHLQDNVPIGVLSITYGGTQIERWMKREVLLSTPLAAGQFPSNPLWSQAYNAMVHPFRHFAVSAIVWYQGEGNVWTYQTYKDRLRAFLRHMESEFSSSEIRPRGYIIEIAPYTGYTNDGSPYIREIQSQVAMELGYGFINTTDLTNDITNIHPVDKFPVGDRLGAMMIADQIGLARKSMFCLQSAQKVGSTVFVQLDGAGTGATMTRTDGWTVINSNGVSYPATATIGGSTVTLDSAAPNPVEARYGWTNEFVASTFNSDGWPLAIGRIAIP